MENCNIVENYLNKYDGLQTKIVYDFNIGFGGIGDLTKFFMYLLNLCIQNNIKIHYLVNNIFVEKYLKLKYSKMYITKEQIIGMTIPITNINDILNMNSQNYYIIQPMNFYSVFSDTHSYNDLHIPLQELFYFSEEVKLNNQQLLFNDDNYISLHLRLGDKYLETDKSFVLCKEDARAYNENDIFTFIENNYNKTILFFCDNHSYKIKIKAKYNNIIITDYNIGHTSLYNTPDDQVLNTITDFYLLSKSQYIYIASRSGFSLMASKFKNIPISKI